MLSTFLISSLNTRYTYLYNYKNVNYFHANYLYSPSTYILINLIIKIDFNIEISIKKQ
jgi:hypothetical protein